MLAYLEFGAHLLKLAKYRVRSFAKYNYVGVFRVRGVLLHYFVCGWAESQYNKSLSSGSCICPGAQLIS